MPFDARASTRSTTQRLSSPSLNCGHSWRRSSDARMARTLTENDVITAVAAFLAERGWDVGETRSIVERGVDIVVDERLCHDATSSAKGLDVKTHERVTFIVPPEQRLRVLADAHSGRQPTLNLHS